MTLTKASQTAAQMSKAVRPEVLVLPVAVGGKMTAIIKIACGVVKFQMAKL